MKFSRLLVIILVVGLLAAYGILGTKYGERQRQKVALASQIAGVTGQLALILLPPADLEQRQTAAAAALDSVINAFPATSNSTWIVNTVLKLAEATGVKAVPMATQPWTVESVHQIDFPVFRLNVAVKGTFTQFTDFVSRLETGWPETLVIAELRVETVPGPVANEVDASLDIAVYARPAVPEPPWEVVR